MSDHYDTDESPGWDAICSALGRLYPDTKPGHWGTALPWSLGGRDPLDGISAYPRTDPVPHWHLVSYGMSELYAKESEDPRESGWGFEFTFRVARDPGQDAPPLWPLHVLQNLGRYVFTSGNHFESGHTISVNGPVNTSHPDTAIRAIAFTDDPELAAIDTPHGRVRFLQVVGLSQAEYEAARQWSTESLLELLGPHLPLFVTDDTRGCLLEDPRLTAGVRDGIRRDGSSTGMLQVSTASFQRHGGIAVIRVGALQAPAVAEGLRGRLPFGNPLAVASEEGVVRFEPTDAFSIDDSEGDAVTIGVPEPALANLTAAFRPERGRTPVPALPGLTVEVVPTVMRDEYGEETGEVVG